MEEFFEMQILGGMDLKFLMKEKLPIFYGFMFDYAKDHTTRANAQTIDDISEENSDEEANQQESINEEIDLELEEDTQCVAASTSRTQSRYKEKDNKSSSKRKRQKASKDGVPSECILRAATELGNDVNEASKILGATKHVIQEQVAQLDKFVSEIERLCARE
ncbi:hypothetical protein Ancab_001950 [Ancistrocladus abbreviatus]